MITFLALSPSGRAVLSFYHRFMLESQPDYLQIILSFTYKGWKIELDQSDLDGQIAYSAWANNDKCSVVAVPYAPSRTLAIKRAKQWVDRRLASTD